MGWLFRDNLTRKELIRELTESEDREVEDGDQDAWSQQMRKLGAKRRVYQTIAHCYRGNVFTGVLWAVQHRMLYDAKGQEIAADKFIACYLLQSDKGRGWGYKVMDESVGPCYYSCPLSYLELAPERNAEWRQQVREHHARKKREREQRREFLNG